jgi:dTDP-4-dehydrorhamnose 3,5-epimerase
LLSQRMLDMTRARAKKINPHRRPYSREELHMILHETGLKDAWLIDLEKRGDERGFFARMFCADEFAAAGLENNFIQINTSSSVRAGTLRGMHYQLPPAAEVKVVKCIRGELWDCIIDLRTDSPTFKRWFGATLSDTNRTMMYVPKGFAHGFITLTDDAEAVYLVSASYAPDLERGVLWDDPAFAISWPRQPVEISAKDRSWPQFDPSLQGIDIFKSGFATISTKEVVES